MIFEGSQNLTRDDLAAESGEMRGVDLEPVGAMLCNKAIDVDDRHARTLRKGDQREVEPTDPGRKDILHADMAMDILAGNDGGHIVDQNGRIADGAQAGYYLFQIIHARGGIEQRAIFIGRAQPLPIILRPSRIIERMKQMAILAMADQAEIQIRLDRQYIGVGRHAEEPVAELRLERMTFERQASSGQIPGDLAIGAEQRVGPRPGFVLHADPCVGTSFAKQCVDAVPQNGIAASRHQKAIAKVEIAFRE
ncbi:MAG: hypothetical protein V4618_18380 [Pseudomonadota bacterium]